MIYRIALRADYGRSFFHIPELVLGAMIATAKKLLA
jgi:hypothetical protein